MAMSTLQFLLLFLALLLSRPSSVSAAPPCTMHKFANGKTFAACNDLPVLNASLHWNYHPYNSGALLDIAFRQIGETSSARWVAWAINPTSKGMVGAQALIAFRQSNNGDMSAYTSPITSYGTQLQKGNLSFPVHDLSAVSDGNEITIFARIRLPNNSTTSVNHLWQQGPLLPGNVLGMHSLSGPSVKSYGNLDFISGKVIETTNNAVDSKKATIKNVHGIINAISWGILMPIGAIIARYIKVFQAADPVWFYLHVTCQCCAYFIGVAGWGTGLWLGSKSSGIQYKGHRCIGLSLFCLATAQVLVGRFLRPKKEHKYRIFWNLFHYAVGYGTILLGIINVYKGLDILEPEKSWRLAYTIIIISLGCVAGVLEIFTCIFNWRTRTTRCAAGLMVIFTRMSFWKTDVDLSQEKPVSPEEVV